MFVACRLVFYGSFICGCPDLGTCFRASSGMAARKGTRAPGISPCPFGSRRTRRRLERPPPGGHSPSASARRRTC
eukprot:7238968-Prymnesium_polylepis.2